MTFFSQLTSRIDKIDSLLCVGIDPHPEDLIAQTGKAALDFSMGLIEATLDVAAAYKPNIAFFESLGPEGIKALKEVISAIPEGIPVILDAKRGDITSTAKAYSRAIFQTLGADAVTINPYLGRDAVQPFLEDPDKGVFLLCKTSNPGASDIQDLWLTSEVGYSEGDRVVQVYEKVALLAQSWNQNDNLGLVVGATKPDALARVRKLVPQLWILAPGVGAQGADLKVAIKAGLRADGYGLLLPVSRGISRSDHPQRAALDIRDAINRIRESVKLEPKVENLHVPPQSLKQLAVSLLDIGCIKFGQFTLKSGQKSPIYIDLRRLAGYPKVLDLVAQAYLPLLHSLEFDRIAALPYAAMPIATAISLKGNWPLIYPRKEVKSYGTKAQVEGPFSPGERVVIVDDLITTGGSKVEAIEKLHSVGLEVVGIVVLIDRQSKGDEFLADHDYQLHSVFRLMDLLDIWESNGLISREAVVSTREFLKAG